MTKLETFTIEPLLHEDVVFTFTTKDGDRINGIGEAWYYEDYVVLVHHGARITRDMIEDIQPDSIELHGVLSGVVHYGHNRVGEPRFLLRGGYNQYYTEDGHDANAGRQMHLGEVK